MWSDKFKMSESYEPVIVATSSMNYYFYFPFSFGKESERSVRTGLTHLKSLYLSLSQPVHSATDLNLD